VPIRPVALLLGAALVVAACSSDHGSDDGSAPVAAEAVTPSAGPAATAAAVAPVGVVAGSVPTTRGLSADTVFVGGLASLTDAAGPAFTGADVGARARVARANAEGGVHGRRVELLEVVDDGGDPARALAAVRQLVDTGGVLAVVPVATNVLTPEVRAALSGAGVPWFGWGPGFCDGTAFGITGCWPAATPFDGNGLGEALASPAFVQAVAAAVPAGAATVVVGDAGPDGQAAVDTVAAQAGAAGLRVVAADASVPADAPVADYTPWVDRIMAAAGGAPPALVIQTGGVANILGLSYQLRVRGYQGAQANPRTYDPAYVIPYPMRYRVEGMVVGTPFTPVETTGVAAVDQLNADLRAVGIAGDQTGVPAILAGYWAADLFLRLLDAAGPDPTPESLLAASNGFTYDGGGVGPTTWPAAHQAPVACTNLARITGFTYDNGLPGGRYDIVGPRSCSS
jgi:ABC-type branched-subunit amino acid transport system substrate-binding protein